MNRNCFIVTLDCHWDWVQDSQIAFKNHSLNLARLTFVSVSNKLLKNKSPKCLLELMLTVVGHALLAQKLWDAVFQNWGNSLHLFALTKL